MPDSSKPPLNERKILCADGETRRPALHPEWAPRWLFASYLGLLSSRGKLIEDAELDEWIYDAKCFRDDINFLLNCQHHEFWSYMVYQKGALAAVSVFLQRATPFYIDIRLQTSQIHIIELYEDILSLVLRIVYRLVTTWESAEAWITTEHMRELIYKNCLVSVPLLLDLLVAVGDADSQNHTVLRAIFEALLSIEPDYKKDLLAALSFFKTAFRSIQTQAENEGFEGAGGGADEDIQTPYDEVAFYTMDCAFTLRLLLEICPETPTICDEIKLGPSIAHFYDTTIPFLYKNICLVNQSATSLYWLNQARLQLLKSFRSISYAYIEGLLQKTGESSLFTEQFVALLTECLSEQTFVIDYQREYPVEVDMEILQETCKDLDTFKASFVLKGYQKELASSTLLTIEGVALTKQNAHVVENNATAAALRRNSHEISLPATPTTSKDINTARDINTEVTAVLEVLPHLGTGFVRRVLSRYDRREDAITAILEKNLPPDLENVDESEEYIPPDVQDKLYEETGVKHFNVYDGDSFDVLTNSKPNCIIKRGKGFPNAPQNAAELLDDKTDLQAVRHRYQELTLVRDDSDEDEYDDSYDALLESEPRVLRSRELKASLANIVDFSDGESSEAEPDQNDKPSTKNGNFCEDPAAVRARNEARWAAKRGDRNVERKPPDVEGAPKGQGQSKDTVRNRKKKEAHKSSRANHNRKAGAAFKRGKGMIP